MPSHAYLIDSNILLRWVKPDDRDHATVATAIDSILLDGGVLCYTSQNLAEFWNTCTRPKERNGYGLSPEETGNRAKYFEDRLRLLPDSLEAHREWRLLLVTYRISGVQVHDARLVAVMQVHGVDRILTFNVKDFARFSEVEAVHPQTLASKRQ